MTILQISDTHNRHGLLQDMPMADVLIHCGDFTDRGTEAEALDFLNWFIALPHPHKLFVTGNHDLCLWDAEGIDDLPPNVLFLQDKACEIEGVKFFGLGYNHSEFHLFGHAHESYGTDVFSNTVFSNGAVLDDQYHLVNAPAMLTLET